MAITLTKDQAFWAQLGLARNNPRLYKTWRDWLHFLEVTPCWELHAGLSDYFGCSESVEKLWIEWKESVDLKLSVEIVEARREAAIKRTWQDADGMPKRFEWLMGAEFWEDERDGLSEPGFDRKGS